MLNSSTYIFGDWKNGVSCVSKLWVLFSGNNWDNNNASLLFLMTLEDLPYPHMSIPGICKTGTGVNALSLSFLLEDVLFLLLFSFLGKLLGSKPQLWQYALVPHHDIDCALWDILPQFPFSALGLHFGICSVVPCNLVGGKRQSACLLSHPHLHGQAYGKRCPSSATLLSLPAICVLESPNIHSALTWISNGESFLISLTLSLWSVLPLMFYWNWEKCIRKNLLWSTVNPSSTRAVSVYLFVSCMAFYFSTMRSSTLLIFRKQISIVAEELLYWKSKLIILHDTWGFSELLRHPINIHCLFNANHFLPRSGKEILREVLSSSIAQSRCNLSFY